MAQTHSKNPRSLFSFWSDSIGIGWNKSREKFGLVVDITLALSAIGIFAFAWYSKRHPKFNANQENEIVSYWFAIIPVGLWLMWFSYHVLKAPHEIYLEQFEKHVEELAAKDSQTEGLMTNISELEKRLDEKNSAEAAAVLKKIDKDVLGYSLSGLRIRKSEVREIGMYSYSGETVKTEEDKTNALVEKIAGLLNKSIGPAEAEMFNGAKPDPLPEPESYDTFTEQTRKWRWHLEWLDAKYDELKRIIEHF